MRSDGFEGIVRQATGEAFGVKNTAGGTHPSRAEIARLAYAFYEARGRVAGDELGDWLRAESELHHHFANVSEAGPRQG